MLHLVRGEGQAAQERAEALITLSVEQGFPQFLAYGTFNRGGALAEQGQVEEGIVQMQQGLAAMRTTGTQMARTAYLAALAAACAKVGRVEEGLTVLAEALAFVDKTGERVSEAELYLLKEQLALQKFQVSVSRFQVEQSPRSRVQSPKSSKTKSQILNPKSQEEAEACFLKAIEISQKQQAKSLELRATMSLVRLRQQQARQLGSRNMHHAARNRLDEAHRMLSEVYHWFTEGFDTKDLQEARALLTELNH